MKIDGIWEFGYEIAALGFSLSYNSTLGRAMQIMPKFAFSDKGENKFLESMQVWLDVSATRGWWAEADTYRLSTKQSESTMHTITKRPITLDDFDIKDMSPLVGMMLEISLKNVNDIINSGVDNTIKLLAIKTLLPEGYVQRRIWNMSYKTLQNIVHQRQDHRLPEWKQFCAEIKERIAHPEFIFKPEEESLL